MDSKKRVSWLRDAPRRIGDLRRWREEGDETYAHAAHVVHAAAAVVAVVHVAVVHAGVIHVVVIVRRDERWR